MSNDSRIEYRALIGRPASILDTSEDRERGHVEEWSSPGESADDVKRQSYLLNRREETLAWVIRWQRRTIQLGPWVDEA